MQRKTHGLWLSAIMLVIIVAFSFNPACSSKKTEQAKKHFDQALQFEDQKMLDDALKEYQEAIKLNPKYADAHFRLGALYHTFNSFSSALDEYNKVLHIDPKYPGIHTVIAHVYYVRGMNAWVRAMNLDQLTYGEADTTRELPYKDKNDLTTLINEFQNTLKTDTTNALTFSKLSQANYILAVDEYQKGIQANPSDTGAILYMALTFSEQGYPQKAMAEYDVLQKVDPRTASVLMTMLKQKEQEKLYYEELRKRQK